MTLRTRIICCLLLLAMLGITSAADRSPIRTYESSVHWLEDYQPALEAAADRSQFALIWFYDPADEARNARFEREVLSQSSVADAIAERCVAVKLPIAAKSQAD